MALDVRAGRVRRVVSGGVRRAPRARYLADRRARPDRRPAHRCARRHRRDDRLVLLPPRFDSPSVFAAILDADDGGLFRISPDCDGWSSKQLYLPDTTILITRMERGWDAARGAFVQNYEGDVLDASLLLMPLCKFIAPTDPRWISTLDAITAELVSDSLVYRYNVEASPDGIAGKEATFSLCSFWWVEALARAGRLDEARLAFEKMLTYANHVGLYSEEIGPTGEQLGNFPQAFTHLALISAAYNLDRQLG